MEGFQRWIAWVIIFGLLIYSYWNRQWFWPVLGGFMLGTVITLGLRWSLAREWKGTLASLLMLTGVSAFLYWQMEDNFPGLLIVTAVSIVGINVGEEMTHQKAL